MAEGRRLRDLLRGMMEAEGFAIYLQRLNEVPDHEYSLHLTDSPQILLRQSDATRQIAIVATIGPQNIHLGIWEVSCCSYSMRLTVGVPEVV
jgi:hypothetical protein